MRMVDLIIKKRNGFPLSEEEIRFFIEGYVTGAIPDYQASAMTMAIYYTGMNNEETAILTDAMMHSGDMLDLSKIDGVTTDKHSTGGVGDKTSLVLAPMVAACGGKVAKMSGRGLGHTGGTLDKMESIPGMMVKLTKFAFINQINNIGLAIIGQSKMLDPADKKLYRLRDVTGTVDSIPLIASSIMSKKLASGSHSILLDVKFGSGAFMKTIDDARNLANTMVDIGKKLNRDTRAILTDMDQPLGRAVGNSIEVKEAIATLKGHGPSDLHELCIEAGAIMLEQCGVCSSKEEAVNKLEESIKNGSALKKLRDLVEWQGGDPTYVDDPSKFEVAKNIVEIKATNEGYVRRIDSLKIGESAMKLGAGREKIGEDIDMSAGIYLEKKVGDKVLKGDVLCRAYTNKDFVDDVFEDIKNAFEIQNEVVIPQPIVHEYIK